MAGDNNRLYFKNYERRPDDEEFAEVMKILKEEGAIISDKYIAPDCDWYHNCIIGEGVFDILYSIDGEGTFLYAENTETCVSFMGPTDPEGGQGVLFSCRIFLRIIWKIWNRQGDL